MSDLNETWKRVGDEFRTLGKVFAERYREGETTEEEKEQIDDALQRLTNAMETTFSAVGNAVRDTDVQEHTKRAADSTFRALGDTFNEIGDAISTALGLDKEEPAGGDGEWGPDDQADPEAPEPDESI
ncbi:MAG: hypothetical protein KJN71_07250 [Acidimicrobiia bacterium]|nr:hypothetical protein [Acidimicrobiia bacterium]NNC75710.1 hypothetical protein [Acidimicrobiia bacterium]